MTFHLIRPRSGHSPGGRALQCGGSTRDPRREIGATRARARAAASSRPPCGKARVAGSMGCERTPRSAHLGMPILIRNAHSLGGRALQCAAARVPVRLRDDRGPLLRSPCPSAPRPPRSPRRGRPARAVDLRRERRRGWRERVSRGGAYRDAREPPAAWIPMPGMSHPSHHDASSRACAASSRAVGRVSSSARQRLRRGPPPSSRRPPSPAR